MKHQVIVWTIDGESHASLHEDGPAGDAYRMVEIVLGKGGEYMSMRVGDAPDQIVHYFPKNQIRRVEVREWDNEQEAE